MRTAIDAGRLYTPEDLLSLSDGERFELVDGRLVEMNLSLLSSWVGGELLGRIRNFSRTEDVGWVFPADTLFRFFPWKPGQVRKPDVAFVRHGRLTVAELSGGYSEVAPDLAVEVISPNDEAEDLEIKIREYRRAGVRLIRVIFPVARVARVHRLDKTAIDLDEADDLVGEDVLPGFRVRVGELFPVAPA
jgi:Uma2 family endonuclease